MHRISYAPGVTGSHALLVSITSEMKKNQAALHVSRELFEEAEFSSC